MVAAKTRFQVAGLATFDEENVTCCYAVQDKVWVTGPGGERWEVYTVVADSETFGTSPHHGDTTDSGAGVCCGGAADTEDTVAAPTASCC